MTRKATIISYLHCYYNIADTLSKLLPLGELLHCCVFFYYSCGRKWNELRHAYHNIYLLPNFVYGSGLDEDDALNNMKAKHIKRCARKECIDADAELSVEDEAYECHVSGELAHLAFCCHPHLNAV